MTIDMLEARLSQLREEEKRAWAHLNYTLGAKDECEKMLASLLQAPPEPVQDRMEADGT